MVEEVTYEQAVAEYEDMFGSVPVIITMGRGNRYDKIEALLEAVETQTPIRDVKDPERSYL